MFPTGNLVDDLEVPGVGTLQGHDDQCRHPDHLRQRRGIGYTGTELQDAINGDPKALAMFETIRAHGAVRMGLISFHIDEAAKRQHTPKVAFVAARRPTRRPAASRWPRATSTCWCARMSMGKLHHAMMGTAAVAIGTAAAIPGTLVNLAAGGGARTAVRFGHPSGTLRVGAEARQADGEWSVDEGHHEPQRAGADGRLGARAAVLVSTKALPAHTGLAGATFVFTDIRRFDLDQASLRKTVLEQRAILENAAVGIILTRDQKLVECNSRAAEIIGREQRQMIGLPSVALFPTPQHYDELGEQARPLLAAGKSYSAELQLRRLDGSDLWCRLYGRAVDPNCSRQGHHLDPRGH
jgi:PAS domain S-box-containing protein